MDSFGGHVWGDSQRMKFAAQFWQSHRNLDIWVSDFDSNLNYNRRIFQQFGVPNQQLRFDGKATDTVTNFTSMVDKFADRKLQHIYLITSDYHISRARAIAKRCCKEFASIVLGSEGIVVRPLPVLSSGDRSESLVRVVRDCGRSFLWIFTERTGASFSSRFRILKFYLPATDSENSMPD